MGDWKLLASILEDVHGHSTAVGKVWLTVLFVFRILVLAAAAEGAWADEQAAFVCNTDQPGCKAVCYDRAFPISLVRFWMLQVVFVSAPSLFYMGHTLYRIRHLEKGRRRRRRRWARLREEMEAGETTGEAAMWAPAEEEEGELRRLRDDSRRRRRRRRIRDVVVTRAPLRGSLLRTYVAHIVARSAVEVCFLLGQCALYGVRAEPLYRCGRPPCPNVVDCYVSRPTEKTVFMAFMVAIGGVSLLLNALEIAHLGARKVRRALGGGGEEAAASSSRSDEDSLASEPSARRQEQRRRLREMSAVVSRQLAVTAGEADLAAARPLPGGRSPEAKPRDLRVQASSLNSSARSAAAGALQRPRESPRRSSSSSSSSSPAGGQTPPGPPPQCRESRQLPGGSPAAEEEERRVLLRTACGAAPSSPNSLGAPPPPPPPPHGENHLRTPPRSVKALLSGRSGSSTVVHRPGVMCSLGSGGLLFPNNARKGSFMHARAPSESASNVSASSSNSLHSSEGSDELGSLHGDARPAMAPARGRRMSMSVFLDISSIMKK